MQTQSKERPTRRRAAATSPQAKENQLIALAFDNAEEQLRNRSASTQIICHFLKLATTQAELELEKLKSENELLQAKKKAIESTERMEELYRGALQAFSGYEYEGGGQTKDD